jgi:choline/glycine/proline betaine transport protein
MRIFWAAVTGLLTIGMLLVGGIVALQYATIIFAVPFAFVLIAVMVGLWKALRVEARRAEAGAHHLPTMLSARAAREERETWKARLERAVNFVGVDDASEYLVDIVAPALTEVADELNNRGVETTVATGDGERPFIELRTVETPHPFVYRVAVTESPVPTYGGRMIGDRDKYARLEVHLEEGGQDYDVMGYTGNQVIHDCLDQYERHLEFLRLE